jgi:endoglycosylceramidase
VTWFGHRAYPTWRALGVALVLVLTVAAQPASGAGAPAGAPARSPAAPLGHAGRWITDARGRVVILHGLNMVYKRPPYTPAAAGFGGSAAATLADNGFDVVRVGVIYRAVEPRPGDFDLRYLRSIASTVALLARHGVYSLLDFHQDQLAEEFGGEGFPRWSVETDGLPVEKYAFPTGYFSSQALNRAFANFWADKPGPGGVGLQERYIAAWEQVARQFAGDPWVLGYDLFNEPLIQTNSIDAMLGSFYAKAIAGIRSVDPRHLIWYEPSFLFATGAPKYLKIPVVPGSSRGLGMSFHDYGMTPKPEKMVVASARAHSRATGVALMMTEFGASNDYNDLARVAGIADANQLPWIEWAYCDCHDPTTSSVPPAAEELVDNPARPGRGANVNLRKLRVLAEPYPRVVAGTPQSYTFDHGTRVFQFRYSITSPDGQQFGPGACTAVVVPPVQYPTGYQVTVNGGRVISRPGAGLLEIGSTGRAPTVTVTVRPAARGYTTDSGPVPSRCR